jgi:hypothetical protein
MAALEGERHNATNVRISYCLGDTGCLPLQIRLTALRPRLEIHPERR